MGGEDTKGTKDTIRVDGKEHEADPSRNLLEVCLELGYDLPYFCWHPALGSVGACRQCAVKQFEDEDDDQGEVVMACMTPADPGSIISIEDADARDFRARVVEWLMVNHPHDCPVCDEGGECHLQDMTVMTGHTYRDFRFDKRSYRNQDLGPLINHEMNRCIQCYRCVRFYDDFAGGADLQAMAAHDHVYFGRHEDGPLESVFAGNLVEVCPTGVFTDKTLKRHYTRKWDLATAPSVCQHCGLGCNTIPGERYGELRRVRARYHGQVNGYFLCDRGRYGYEFVDHERRIREALAPRGPDREAERLEPEDALERVMGMFGGAAKKSGTGGEGTGKSAGRGDDGKAGVRDQAEGTPRTARVIGIGSPRASLEANFALRELVGEDAFHRGVDATEAALVDRVVDLLRTSGARISALRETREADAILVLGEDPTNTAPMLDLSLRQALRTVPARKAASLDVPLWHDKALREIESLEAASPLWIASPVETELDRRARWAYRASPGDIAELGLAVAAAVERQAAEGEDREEGASPRAEERGGKAETGDVPPPSEDAADALDRVPEAVGERAREIARALLEAERPLVVSGTSLRSPAVLEAAGAVTRALVSAREAPPALFLTVPEANSVGLSLLGGPALDQALERVESGEARAVVVLENDLTRRVSSERALDVLDRVPVVVVDHLAHATSAAADVVLPAATFAEADGTAVNNEGRAQRFVRVMDPDRPVQASWRWLRDLTVAVGRRDPGWERVDDVTAALARSVPDLARAPEAVPEDRRRLADTPIPRQPHRYSGRTAMHADRSVEEPEPPEDRDAPYAFSMEGHPGPAPAGMTPRFWLPGWNSVQALNRFQEEIAGPLRDDGGGVRLLDGGEENEEDGPGAPSTDRAGERAVPGPSSSGDGTEEPGSWRAVPLHHCFGSDWISGLAPGVCELAPEAYVALAPSEAEMLGLDEGTGVELDLGDEDAVPPGPEEAEAGPLDVGATSRTVPVKLRAGIPEGCVGVPWGLPGLEDGARPHRIRIRRNGNVVEPPIGSASREAEG